MDYVTYISALSESVPYLFQDSSCTLRRLQCEGVLAYQRGSKEAFDAVLKELATHGTIPQRIPFFQKGTFASSMPVAFAPDLLNFLGAFNKLSVSGVDAAADYDSYLQRNREVYNFSGTRWEEFIPIAPSVRRWIRENIPVPSVVRCKPGPGSTYEKYFQHDKFWALFRTLDSRPISRFTDVPKDVGGRRLIAIEPCSRQFIQQGIAGAMRVTPGYRAFFDLHSNARHLRLASLSHCMTVDLKDASDRIPLGLVEYLLPEWYPILASHSSAYAEIGDQLHPINSAATMGCGFCFELETLVFAFVAALAPDNTEYNVLPRSCSEFLKRLSSLSCYGDDLVIPRAWWCSVEPVFLRCGFVPSDKKTCLTEEFKETVGFWIPKGFPVRRFLPKLSGTRTELSWETEDRILDLSRLSLSTGYAPLGRALQQKLLKSPIRWNREIQRLEIKLLCESSKTRPSSLSDDIGYWTYWKSYSPRSLNEFVKTTKTFTWLPLEPSEGFDYIRREAAGESR